MARSEDVSGKHFEWLVAGRSRNQQATLTLYKAIEANEAELSANFADRRVAHQLVGIGFSLWRAVFLSDLTGDVADQLVDVKRFLRSLIAHNAVLYQTDFSAREWTFTYYLENAVYRLGQLPDAILPPAAKAATAGSAKDEWTNTQAAFETAIVNFATALAER